MKTFVITKLKNLKFKIFQVDDIVDTYEGNRIPFSNRDIQSIDRYILKRSIEKGEPIESVIPQIVTGELIIDGNIDREMYNAFLQSFQRKLVWAKENVPDQYRATLRTKVPCDIKGDWKLVRNSRKDRIHIARRKTRKLNKPYDESWMNSVCIPDDWKRPFFNLADSLHYPNGKMHFIVASDGNLFDFWNDRMDEEYRRQVEAYRKGEPK